MRSSTFIIQSNSTNIVISTIIIFLVNIVISLFKHWTTQDHKWRRHAEAISVVIYLFIYYYYDDDNGDDDDDDDDDLTRIILWPSNSFVPQTYSPTFICSMQSHCNYRNRFYGHEYSNKVWSNADLSQAMQI